MRKLPLLILFTFLLPGLQAQVDFDSGNNEWFKNYGLPNVRIYTSYKEALAGGKNVIKMDLREDNVCKQIKKINKVPAVQLVQMISCDVKQLPAEMGALRDLFIFVSKQNPISYISPEIAGCSNLMYLELCDTRLDSLPREMQYLPSLELFRLIGNQSSDTLRINDSLKRMPRLRSVQFTNTDLYKFPGFILRSKKLESIILSSCRIDSLPEEIIYLEALKELNMEGNRLTGLPSKLTKMKNLEVLSLKNNQLTTISEFIAYLPKLRVLDISENQIPLEELDILRVIFKRKGQLISDYEKLMQIEDEKRKNQPK